MPKRISMRWHAGGGPDGGDGEDPYAHVDLRLATKLGGALFLIGIAYVLLVLPLAPPARGAAGWAGVGTCLGIAAAAAVWLLRRRRPLSPDALLAFVVLGIAVTGAFRYFGGPASPFGHLLFLACMYGAAVHPAPRALGLLGLATAASLSPVLYEDVGAAFAAQTAGNLAFTWSLSGVILVWMTRTRQQRREAHEAREQADQLARIDPLTGLGNRRAMEEALPVAVAAARRDGRPLGILVADLDEFKRVNDTSGHHAGDEVLRATARALASAVRVPDPCFRWGGDEFVALLPGATAEEAAEVAERVRTSVALACPRHDGRPVRITVGTAELRDGEAGEDLFARADADLLRAKGARGRVARAG